MPPKHGPSERRSRAIAVSKTNSPTAPLTDAEGKFLYHLVLLGGITGGSRVGIEQIFASSKRELLDEELALVDSAGRGSGQRTPNTGKENYISKPMIKRMAAKLQKRFWASEEPTHQDPPYVSHEHSGYMLNGDSYISVVLTAKIAFALQAWALNHSTPEIPPDQFIAQICREPGITRPAVVKRLEWLREQKYITDCPASSSPAFVSGRRSKIKSITSEDWRPGLFPTAPPYHLIVQRPIGQMNRQTTWSRPLEN